MYVKHYEKLTADEKSKIEDMIFKSSKSFKEIAKSIECTEEAVIKVANSMGIYEGNTIEAAKKNATNNDVAPDATRKQKKHIFLSEEQKAIIKQEYESRKNKDGLKNRLANKYKVSLTTITRIIEGDERKAKADVPMTTEVKDLPTISAAVPTTIAVPLQNYISITTLQVKLDPKAGTFSNTIFERDLATMKYNYDFESDISKWFENNIKDKHVSEVEVYFKVSPHDVKITSLLVKYAFRYKVNLTYIIPGGVRKETLVDDFVEGSANIRKIINVAGTVPIFVYDTNWDVLNTAEKIYSLYYCTGPKLISKQIFISDNPAKISSKLANGIAKAIEKGEDYKYNIYEMVKGNYTNISEGNSVSKKD